MLLVDLAHSLQLFEQRETEIENAAQSADHDYERDEFRQPTDFSDKFADKFTQENFGVVALWRSGGFDGGGFDKPHRTRIARASGGGCICGRGLSQTALTVDREKLKLHVSRQNFNRVAVAQFGFCGKRLIVDFQIERRFKIVDPVKTVVAAQFEPNARIGCQSVTVRRLKPQIAVCAGS